MGVEIPSWSKLQFGIAVVVDVLISSFEYNFSFFVVVVVVSERMKCSSIILVKARIFN
jgi:hypothetical protein